MDTDNYFKEANCQLSDQDSYKTLQPDPTLQHSKIMNDILDQFKNENLLPEKNCRRTKINAINPKTAKFYIAPKIQNENNPGKLVMNSINCHFVDYHLQPLK